MCLIVKHSTSLLMGTIDSLVQFFNGKQVVINSAMRPLFRIGFRFVVLFLGSFECHLVPTNKDQRSSETNHKIVCVCVSENRLFCHLSSLSFLSM